MNIIIINEDESVRLNPESILEGQNERAVALRTKNINEAMDYLSRNGAAFVIIAPYGPEVMKVSTAPALNLLTKPSNNKESEPDKRPV